jgi:CPA1 family monovalent cation:H+ antiporter
MMPLSETVFVLMALLATGIVASGLFRKLPIPYTVVLVLIGMMLSQLSLHWTPLHHLRHFHLTPDLVLFIFLPALIFESGLNLNSRQLIKDIAPVMMLAVPALLFSTAAVGVGLWLVLPIELNVALLFGALISATDPVAVIALFKELGTPERLTVLVEGESLLNDATAIVVVGILLSLSSLSGGALEITGHAVGQFVLVFFGGALVGALSGFVISWLMSKFAHETSAVLVLSMVLAYLSFVIAEHGLHVSGVMAVVACAVTRGVFGVARLPQEAVDAMHETWEFIAHICNTLLFLFIGLTVDVGSMAGDLFIALFAVVLVQAARASMVYSLVPATVKLFDLPKVTLGERHIMFWGGLKGGLAIAIVLSLPHDMVGRELLINLTLSVVLFTLLVNAPTIRPLIRKLGIDRLSDDECAELKRGINDARFGATSLLQRFAEAGLLSKANRHVVTEKTDDTLLAWMPEVIGDDEFRHQRLNGLRAEMQELDALFRAGVLRQYAYLDLRGEIQRKRDHIVTEHRQHRPVHSKRGSNIVLRIEDAMVKWLREKDWAAGLLSAYQNRRLSHHLMRDIARILMAEAALDSVRDDKDISEQHREALEKIYFAQLDMFRTNIRNTRNSFPEFFDRFEYRLSSRAALVAAMHRVELAHRDGSITTKVFAYLEHRIQHAINSIPPITEPPQAMQPRDLVELVPLFAGLPEVALDKIAALAQPVNYLAGDTVIGVGEHGDALYIIARGRVEVFTRNGDTDERNRVAELGAGEFFGEMALLGDHVRSADVVARSACTLLRIRSHDVLQMAQQHHEITERLNQARDARADTL